MNREGLSTAAQYKTVAVARAETNKQKIEASRIELGVTITPLIRRTLIHCRRPRPSSTYSGLRVRLYPRESKVW